MSYQYMNERLPELKFDKKRSRVKHCPCGKDNKDGKFVPYAGYENKGYCHSCGDTFLPELPKVEQLDKPHPRQFFKPKETPPPKPVSSIPIEVFKQSLKNYNENNFVKFLLRLFGSEITGKLIRCYFIGTSKHWQGANVFWQIDKAGKIRTGKIMLYSSTTGKRVKEPYNHINWVQSVLNLPEFKLRQCFFGEHLINQLISKPIAIVESEKTAIVASVYLPQFIWIAAGSKDGLNPDKCQVLKGRSVILYPDLNGFDKWSQKAKELSHLARFTVSDLLERKASEAEKKQGLDLADYLIRFDYKKFIQLIPAIPAIGEQLQLLTETHTGKEFDNMILAFVSSNGKEYDLLFDSNEIAITAKTSKVKELETYYNKSFVPITIAGENYFANIVNNNKIQHNAI